tara:strand:+ start:746 stop:2044 length:1299 start_codon:yes stop_codon:yes gene_type:complete
MKKKFLSVIIPVFNTSIKLLKQCVSSVAKLDTNDVEIIIVDDFSNSETESFLKSIKKKNIKVYRNFKNKGISYSRNFGIKLSNSEYITFVDSDDYIFKNKFKLIKNSIIRNNNPDIAVTKFDTNYFKITDNKEFKDKNFKFKSREKIIYDFSKINFKSFWHFETVWCLFFKKEFLLQNKIKFENKAFRNEDQEYVIKSFFLSKKTLIINKKFYFYRIHNSNIRYNNQISEIKMFNGNIKLIENLINFFKRNKFKNNINNLPLTILESLIVSSVPFVYKIKNKTLIKMNNLISKILSIFKESALDRSKLNFLDVKTSLDHFFNNVINSKIKKNIYIYCASESSIPIIHFLNDKKIHIKGLIDSNDNLKNKFFFNIKISSLNEVHREYIKNENIIILVTHPEKKTYLKIKEQIIKKGFLPSNIKNIGYKKILSL